MEPLQHSNQQIPESAPQAPTAADQEKHRRLFQRGLRWLCAGGTLLLLSVSLNFLLFHSDQSFVSIMYIMTTLGAICVMKSMVDILGF